MNKFQRNYELTIQASGGGPDVLIKPPFTVEFDITRHRYSNATLSTIRIYNLSENNRAKLRKNQIDFGLQKRLLFRAGYGDELSTVLTGNVTQAFSVRQGTNYITQIEVFDGGFAFANANTEIQYQAGTPYKTVVTDLVKSLGEYDVGLGSIGKIQGTTGRGLSVSGSTINNLKEITQGKFFIDNGVGNVLSDYTEGGVSFTEVVPAPLKIINSASGLLGTPVRSETYVNIEMLFEPKILAGQRIQLDSSTGKNFNGVYKVLSIHHKGTISDAVNGDATTALSLEYNLGSFKEILKG